MAKIADDARIYKLEEPGFLILEDTSQELSDRLLILDQFPDLCQGIIDENVGLTKQEYGIKLENAAVEAAQELEAQNIRYAQLEAESWKTWQVVLFSAASVLAGGLAAGITVSLVK